MSLNIIHNKKSLTIKDHIFDSKNLTRVYDEIKELRDLVDDMCDYGDPLPIQLLRCRFITRGTEVDLCWSSLDHITFTDCNIDVENMLVEYSGGLFTSDTVKFVGGNIIKVTPNATWQTTIYPMYFYFTDTRIIIHSGCQFFTTITAAKAYWTLGKRPLNNTCWTYANKEWGKERLFTIRQGVKLVQKARAKVKADK